MTESGITYKGRKLEDLTKEELIEAVKVLHHLIENMRKDMSHRLEVLMGMKR